MKSLPIEKLEKKYNIEYIYSYTNKWGEVFARVKDLEDGGLVEVQIRFAENVNSALDRVFGSH